MKVAVVASEMVPFVKTGGLGEVTGTLAREISKLGHEVYAFLPRYRKIDLKKWSFQVESDSLTVSLGAEKETGRILGYSLDGAIRIFLVDHPGFFSRDDLYGTPLGDYPDNDRRFIFFQRAVLETLKAFKIKPDIIHCHDWQTGLIPVYLKTLYAGDTNFKKTKSIFSIHNLGYQGNFPPDSLPTTGLGWEQFKMERLEFYGKVSFLKGGILDADAITTVSEHYAREILTKEFGCGMENILASRKNKLRGILNGLDYREWNPETDPDIVERFGPKTADRKIKNKIALQQENDLEPSAGTPLLGMVSRLDGPKGVEILLQALGSILQLGVQFVLLGSGDEKYHRIFRDFAKKNPDAMKVHIVFDSHMAKRIYAGCDMALFPSYSEPAGLGQLIALRYGTIPIAHATGGLADTIREFHAPSGEGNGFVFHNHTAEALAAAVKKAVESFRNERNWKRLVQNALLADYSWTAAAKKYVHLYAPAGHKV
jgi:starch synthase